MAKVASAGSVAPRAVNEDSVTPERVCSTAHARQELLAACRAAFVRMAGRGFTVKALAGVHWICLGV